MRKYFSEEQIEVLKQFDSLNRTRFIVGQMFSSLEDKAGDCYIGHLKRVSFPFNENSDEYIIALLHDLVEDTKFTFDDLKELGYSDFVIDTLKLLTREKGVDYMEYINRIAKSKNKSAMKVKLSDLCDNMNLNRLPKITEKDIKRALKYKNSYEIIVKEVLSDE